MASGRKLLNQFSQSLGITIPIKNIQIDERHMIVQNIPKCFWESVASHIELEYRLQHRLTAVVTFATMTIWVVYVYLPDGGQLKGENDLQFNSNQP